MKKHLLFHSFLMRYSLILLFTFITACSLQAAGGNVFVNQAGYKPHFPKFVFTSGAADSFYIRDVATNSVRFRSNLALWKTSDVATGLTLYRGDFSSFKETGNFYITTSQSDTSYKFAVSAAVYNEPYNKILKGYYFQRCGSLLSPVYASVYYHPACHKLSDGTYHPATGLSGYRQAPGGWHDAGDYGKYVVNAGITVGTLLMAYETFTERFSQDNLNIPESGNGIPDILDEVKYELDWLFSMQNTDGGVFAKLTKKQFEGFIMPQSDTGDRYIYEIASTATADFAAMMARAYRVYSKYNQAYADKCLAAAELAWTYLENHPGIVPAGGFKNPADTNTGAYGDTNDKDERLWASAELFSATGNAKYNSYFSSNYRTNGIFNVSMGWQNLTSMAQLTYLFTGQVSADANIIQALTQGLNTYCASLVTKKNQNGLHVVLNSSSEYFWGSNSELLNRATLLLMGYQKTNNAAYYETALDQLNYILGVNACNMSYVTGMGSKSPMNTHHRPSISDGITNPVPGLMAGGPDKNISDDPVLSKTFTGLTPPAKCYVDDRDSYASNEICINWNAPLVLVAGYFNSDSDVSVSTVSITSPVGGENWQTGSSHNITWSCSNVTNVKIEYSTDNGAGWATIITSTPAGAGSYGWTVPNSPSVQCKVKVSDAGNVSLNSVSTNTFTISAIPIPSITTTAPLTGANWMSGSQQTVSWTSSNVSGNVNIKLSTDGGVAYPVTLAANTSNDGTETITVPANPSGTCRIKVESATDANVYGINPGNFTIAGAPKLTITSPNGGEIWGSNSLHNITWSGSNIDNIKIEYSINNGTDWMTIAGSVSAGTGNYNWTIPDNTSNLCKVRISDAGSGNPNSISNNSFAIYSQPDTINCSFSVGSMDVTSASSFRMTGVPGKTDYSISRLMKGKQVKDWQVYHDNGKAQNYFIAYDGSSTFNLTPGRGFWVISRQSIDVTGAVSSVELDNSACYSVPVHDDWNIISNPFEKRVSWNSIQTINGVIESLWDFTGSFVAVTNLEPYKGYYFRNLTGLTSLRIPYIVTAALGKSSDFSSGGDADRISLKLIRDNNEKSEVFIGFGSGTLNGYDAMDLFKPVADFERERIVIRNDSLETAYKYLFADYRPFTGMQKYDINLKLIPNQTYTIRITGGKSFDAGICIIDKRLNNFYDMTGINEIKIKSAFENNNYELIIAESSYLQELKQKYEIPLTFELEQNYPNPFNPSTVISYSLAKSGNVKLTVYDLAGKEIQTLVEEYQNAGRYNVRFSIKDSDISSGVYYYTLLSDGQTLTRKLMLLK
ncbi:MAG: glycoside hydrolase family 9 protein [Ignavibacteria bacterium]